MSVNEVLETAVVVYDSGKDDDRHQNVCIYFIFAQGIIWEPSPRKKKKIIDS